MKPAHYFAILILTMVMANPAFSQAYTTIGVTAGMNLPNVEFESVDNESKEQYIGYYGGLHAQIPIKGDFSLVSSLIYSRKGWHNDPFPATGYPGAEIHLDYLDLQLSGQYAITKSLVVNAGVEVGRLLNSTASNDPDNSFLDDFYQKSDFSLLLGVNYKIWKGFSLDARYLLGLNHLYKGNATDQNGNDIGEVKDGTFGVFQIGISADIITFKPSEQKM